MKTITVVGAVIVLSIALAGCSKPSAAVPSSGIVIKRLFEKAIADEFIRDREVIVELVEIPPNTTMDWHSHPGEEFHYYLQGEVELRFDGSPSVDGKPGVVAHVPYRKVHTVVTREKGGKVVVFRIHSKGEPVRYPEKPSVK